MSTRGVYGFIINGEEKISYNHADSYPEVLGHNILHDVSKIEDYDVVRNNVAEIEMVDPTIVPDCEDMDIPDIEQLREKIVFEADNKFDWYTLLRNHQGRLKPHFDVNNPLQYMTEGRSLFNEPLFCEYAYIVNFDTNMVEMYSSNYVKLGFSGTYRIVEKDDGLHFIKVSEELKEKGYPVAIEFPIYIIMGMSEEKLKSILSEIAFRMRCV